jgi:hypothetical protein
MIDFTANLHFRSGLIISFQMKLPNFIMTSVCSNIIQTILIEDFKARFPEVVELIKKGDAIDGSILKIKVSSKVK